MEKLLVLLFVLLLAFSICACSDSKTESDMVSTSHSKTELDMVSTSSNPNSSINDTSRITEEDAPETSRITEEDALEIASQYWGIKNGDKDEDSGFTFLIMPVESSSDNFAIALKWFVDNHHYSTVDSIEIDPYTGKIVNIE